jgi:MFS family permease
LTDVAGTSVPEVATGSPRLAILLAMAMFVLVVDTSLMNVSISSVVRDLDTTVSGVQSAIALEALVSAAFILIGSKVGDLIGRKRAYVLGLLGYAIGALSMALAQGLTAIIVFWAIVGGLGASLLLPAMQSLIHGNFTGAAQKQAYAGQWPNSTVSATTATPMPAVVAAKVQRAAGGAGATRATKAPIANSWRTATRTAAIRAVLSVNRSSRPNTSTVAGSTVDARIGLPSTKARMTSLRSRGWGCRACPPRSSAKI